MVDALVAIAGSDPESGRALAREAARESPSSLLPNALANYLGRGSTDGVYSEPSGFAEFIENGDNPRLYECTIARLAEIHAALRPERVLDIGCGDGRVTVGVVQQESQVHLLEPSAELLLMAQGRFTESGQDVVAHQSEVGAFLRGLDAEESAEDWSLVQSTYAMHTLRPSDRVEVLARLRQRTNRFVFVEFDVPHFEDRSRDHADYAAARYELGLREYAAHPNVVSNFLMPVLVGQFDPTRQRHTFEQPIAFWSEQMLDAGWSSVSFRTIADYWWAPAVLVEVVNRD